VSRKPYTCASGLVAAMVVLSGACSSNQGSPATGGGSGGQVQGGAGGRASGTGENSGGAGGPSGRGGQSTAAGGSFGGSGGQSGQGGQSTAAGGSSGGAVGNGGQTTDPAGGGNLGSTGGGTGQGGSEPPSDAAAGAGGSGGQGGDTTRPRADAADLAPGGTGGSPGSDAAGDSAGDAAEPDASVSSHPRRVLLCDEGNRRILLVDLESPASAVWSTLVNDPNKHGDGLRDIQLVGGDRVAASTAKGYVEIDVNTGEIKKEVSSFSGVESLRRLPNGNTILGGNSDGGVTLQELDSQDAVVPGHKVTFTNYSQFRMFRRTPQGTFLMGVANKLAEVNWNKQSVWEMDFPAPAGHDPAYIYQGLRLPDNTIAVTVRPSRRQRPSPRTSTPAIRCLRMVISWSPTGKATAAAMAARGSSSWSTTHPEPWCGGGSRIPIWYPRCTTSSSSTGSTPPSSTTMSTGCWPRSPSSRYNTANFTEGEHEHEGHLPTCLGSGARSVYDWLWGASIPQSRQSGRRRSHGCHRCAEAERGQPAPGGEVAE
jgi:hypothetical protein